MRPARLLASLLLLAPPRPWARSRAGAAAADVSPRRVEVRVLDLDVDVTDSKGQPVTDLTREDFTVKIAGKPVPIDYFTRVDAGHDPRPGPGDGVARTRSSTAYKKGEDATSRATS